MITIQKFPKKGRSGELSTEDTEYFDFVVLVNRFKVRTFSPYDSFRSYLATGANNVAERDALIFALELAEALNLPHPRHVSMVERQVVTWVEEYSND